MHQSIGIERRTCKHLRAYRGDAAETERVGREGPAPRASSASSSSDANAPPVLLAHKWETDVDLTGWWLSEKLDGVRAYWDGTRFLSRLGNPFYPPESFTEKLPAHPLDGELFGGRKTFQRTVGIVKRQDRSPLWNELTFVVFDMPAHPGPFEARIEAAKSALANVPRTRVLEHERCEGIAHLTRRLAEVEALGGEGLMARKPGSAYVAGRSDTLLKIKSFKDAEARVVDHLPGTGKHAGRLGALAVELADGTRFHVGTGLSDAERMQPPPRGAIITFRYQELTDGGVPRFPTFVGVRIDADRPSTLVVDRKATDAAPRETASASAPRPTSVRRRFEREENGLRYFWEIEVVGATHRVTSGTFTEDEDTFESSDEALEALEREVRARLKEGFEDPSARAETRAAEDANVEPASTKAEPAEETSSTTKTEPASTTKTEGTASTPGTRRFELIEGSSRKFWEVSVHGTDLVTRYGRIGTSGQSTTKAFATPEAAAKARDQLVLEKTGKGYRAAE
jgi:DNA ligase-1